MSLLEEKTCDHEGGHHICKDHDDGSEDVKSSWPQGSHGVHAVEREVPPAVNLVAQKQAVQFHTGNSR